MSGPANDNPPPKSNVTPLRIPSDDHGLAEDSDKLAPAHFFDSIAGVLEYGADVVVVAQEAAVIDRKDAKERELRATESDPSYLELIARDRLNFYKPGEHVFRIAR